MEKYREIIEKANINGNWFRLGKTFHTRNGLFFLDTGTGKVFKVRESVFRILECLFKTNSFDNLYKISLPGEELEDALKEICTAIETQNLFAAPLLTKDNISGQHIFLEEELKNNMTSITLELTERCNLRCKYCIYSKTNDDYRSFGEHDMSLETAQKSIDFLMDHASEDKQVYIGFYGGEPLLRFPLIKQLIEYTKVKYGHRKLMFSMTSNMTLMTEEIAEFLAAVKDFSVVVSLDGPAEVHDMHRVFSDGKGTFAAVMNGLNTYIKYKEKSVNKDLPLSFSVVMEQPYTKEKFGLINDFYKKLRERYNISVLISYVSRTSKAEPYIEINKREENEWTDEAAPMFIYDPIAVWTLNELEPESFAIDYFKRGTLIEVHTRSISDTPMENYSLNGCCVPGARRLYVTAKGDFLPCERIGSHLPIGNIDTGFDYEVIKNEYINSFIDQEIAFCGECWAINLCSNCYIDSIGDNKIDFSHRHNLCSNTRKRISESLSIYHDVMTLNPDMINALNEIVIE